MDDAANGNAVCGRWGSRQIGCSDRQGLVGSLDQIVYLAGADGIHNASDGAGCGCLSDGAGSGVVSACCDDRKRNDAAKLTNDLAGYLLQ